MNLAISALVEESIEAAAEQVQAHFEYEQGVHYSINDLKATLIDWLTLSVEELAEEAAHHCFRGHPSYSFNRDGFHAALKKRKPAYTPQEADQLGI